MPQTSFVIIAIFLSGTVTSAQLIQRTPTSSPSQTVLTGVTSKAAQAGQSMIHGAALDANSSPLPNASVRLRNLASSEIEKTATADALGEFTFIVQPDIPYVVEIADQAGRVIAVGNVVTAQAGEVAAAIVPVPLRLPALAGVFGNSTASVIGSATGAGLTAIQANSQPAVSPDR